MQVDLVGNTVYDPITLGVVDYICTCFCPNFVISATFKNVKNPRILNMKQRIISKVGYSVEKYEIHV